MVVEGGAFIALDGDGDGDRKSIKMQNGKWTAIIKRFFWNQWPPKVLYNIAKQAS